MHKIENPPRTGVRVRNGTGENITEFATVIWGMFPRKCYLESDMPILLRKLFYTCMSVVIGKKNDCFERFA